MGRKISSPVNRFLIQTRKSLGLESSNMNLNPMIKIKKDNRETIIKTIQYLKYTQVTNPVFFGYKVHRIIRRSVNERIFLSHIGRTGL